MLAEVNPTGHFARCTWPETLYLHRCFCCQFLGLPNSLFMLTSDPSLQQAISHTDIFSPFRYLQCDFVKVPVVLQLLVKYSVQPVTVFTTSNVTWTPLSSTPSCCRWTGASRLSACLLVYCCHVISGFRYLHWQTFFYIYPNMVPCDFQAQSKATPSIDWSLILAAQSFVGHEVYPCVFSFPWLQLFKWTGETMLSCWPSWFLFYHIQSVPRVSLLWLVSDMGNTEGRTLINLRLFAWLDAEGCGFLDSEKTAAWEQTGPLREYILCKAINNYSGSPSFQCCTVFSFECTLRWSLGRISVSV